MLVFSVWKLLFLVDLNEYLPHHHQKEDDLNKIVYNFQYQEVVFHLEIYIVM